MNRLQPRKITRKRELRACIQCRRRKLKCDSQRPCTSCTKRSDDSCTYELFPSDPHTEHERHRKAEAKLEHLEKLIQELSQSQNDPSTNLQDAASEVREGPRSQFPGSTIVYNGATHWTAMLNDIEELRDVFSEQDYTTNGDDIGQLDSQSDGIAVLFGAAKSLSFDQVLLYFLPTRPEADRLVAAYFRTTALVAPPLHAFHFRRLYERFWDDAGSVPRLWVSILFSVLDIAERTLSLATGFGTDQDLPPPRFAVPAAHCLVLADYYRPQPFVAEALLLFTQARCLMTNDIPPNIAVVLGTLSRLMFVMGYHRDADETSKPVSAFEGEMRRRTWSLFMQLDMLIAFQLGLPCNIQPLIASTKPPSNIPDSDFDEGSEQLPPVRPATEVTGLVFYIAKHRLMNVFEKILRHTLSISNLPIDELEAIDQELSDTYAALPTCLHTRLMTDSIWDSPALVVTRLCVSVIYHKCLCILHRKHASLGREHSIQVCYDSATRLVGQFVDIYPEFQPGGQLETQRWFMASISWHDFLLGCTVLCLCVCATRLPMTMAASGRIVDIHRSLRLLRSAHTICETRSGRSKDTYYVQQLIATTLRKFHFGVNLDIQEIPLLSTDASSDARIESAPARQIDSGVNGDIFTDTEARAEDPTWDMMDQFLNYPGDEYEFTADEART